jgi:hypothetical protein
MIPWGRRDRDFGILDFSLPWTEINSWNKDNKISNNQDSDKINNNIIPWYYANLFLKSVFSILKKNKK